MKGKQEMEEQQQYDAEKIELMELLGFRKVYIPQFRVSYPWDDEKSRRKWYNAIPSNREHGDYNEFRATHPKADYPDSCNWCATMEEARAELDAAKKRLLRKASCPVEILAERITTEMWLFRDVASETSGLAYMRTFSGDAR